MVDGRIVRSLVAVWLLMIAIGAATMGLLRSPSEALVDVAWLTLVAHKWLGTLLAVTTLAAVLRRPGQDGLLAAGLVCLTTVLGWWTAQTWAPLAGASHAVAASLSTVVLARLVWLRSQSTQLDLLKPWTLVGARIALALMLVQIVVGALLRHKLVTVEWHLLVGGLAVLAVLIPAAAVLYDPRAVHAERRAARWVMAITLGQVSLGTAVFVMVLVGLPPLLLWLAGTIAHVTIGTATALALVAFIRQLQRAH